MPLDYSTVNQALLDTMPVPGAAPGTWDFDPRMKNQWAHELVARVAVLVGTDPIEYASGHVEDVDQRDRNGAGTVFKGEAALFTSAKIVHATFSVTRQANSTSLNLEAAIVSYRRSDIDSVSSESISGDLSSSANSSGSFTVHLRSGQSITLPVAKKPQSAEDQDLLEFVSTVLT